MTRPRKFRFSVVGVEYTREGFGDSDVAPNHNAGRYALQLKQWLLDSSEAYGRPRSPIAGKSFAVQLEVWRLEDGEPVTTGAVQCVARIGTKAVAAKGALVRGVPGCTIAIPPNSSGEQVRGTIAVSAQGGRVTKKFAFEIL